MFLQMRRKQSQAIFKLIIALLMINTPSGKTADNIRYSGNLVAEPCTLLPADENIVVDFGTIINKYLYLYHRTKSQPFELHLTECDTSLGKLLKATFSGKESTALPGLLALDGARGIAIGLETQDGEVLPLNQQMRGQEITDGDNTIILQAYVQGEPEAIANKTITQGDFTAIATFTLDYE